jgi:hypothetical protein
VSYTRRDGMVTDEMLRGLHAALTRVSQPFIHAVEEPRLRHQQLAVVAALIRSSVVVLVVSPFCHLSPWVRFELGLAKLLRRRIIRVRVTELVAWQHDIRFV